MIMQRIRSVAIFQPTLLMMLSLLVGSIDTSNLMAAISINSLRYGI